MSAFTDADVQLVAEAMWQKLKDTDFPNLSGPPTAACFEDARAVLTALAGAGRLAPDVAGRGRVRVTQTWYRSLQADGSIWCESRNAREMVKMSEGIAAKFEQMVTTEVTGAWEPWVAADGTP
jgi:hypothetical protein